MTEKLVNECGKCGYRWLDVYTSCPQCNPEKSDKEIINYLRGKMTKYQESLIKKLLPLKKEIHITDDCCTKCGGKPNKDVLIEGQNKCRQIVLDNILKCGLDEDKTTKIIMKNVSYQVNLKVFPNECKNILNCSEIELAKAICNNATVRRGE